MGSRLPRPRGSPRPSALLARSPELRRKRPGQPPHAPGAAPRNRSPDKCRNADVKPAELTLGQLENAVQCLINKCRQQRGRSKLKSESALSRAAVRHSQTMRETGCFDHICSGEQDLSGRVHSTSYLPCNCNWRIGENIAWGEKKNGKAAAITKAWMNSPPRKKHILSRSFEQVGVGVVRGSPVAAGDRSAASYTMVFGVRD